MRRAVAGKARVHELAKELGVTSKEVLSKLAEQGEYVKSASSTVEAPVARRLRDAYAKAAPPATGGATAQAANGAPAPAKKASAGKREGGTARRGGAAAKSAAQPAQEA